MNIYKEIPLEEQMEIEIKEHITNKNFVLESGKICNELLSLCSNPKRIKAKTNEINAKLAEWQAKLAELQAKSDAYSKIEEASDALRDHTTDETYTMNPTTKDYLGSGE